MPEPRITIHDIAELAAVSAGTVSRVVNGQPGVGAATRDRIRRLITEYGFTANAAAQRLSTGQARAIGVVFPQPASEFVMHPTYPGLLAGLGDAAERAGYDLMLLSVPGPQEHQRLIDAIQRRRIDGAVLPAAGPRDPLVRLSAAAGLPTVLIGHRTRLGDVPWVDCDHDRAIHDLTTRLIRAGRRRLVLLNGPATVSACGLRARGYRNAIHEAGQMVLSSEEYAPGFDSDHVRLIARQLLCRHPADRPTAVIGANDIIASAVLEIARDIGLDVPGDLAVTGFDDQVFAAHTTPGITTVRMPLREIGHAAAQLLLAAINGDQLPRRHLILTTEVVVRGSTPRLPA